ncbi:hypothetical protein BYT27DRAFT_6806758 [Phlegmacium glaucopus]|nr:hypothetical protein BYT27DRAFT_6806758 [Phlegmacium glaucopus]
MVGANLALACGILLLLTTTRTPVVDENYFFSSDSGTILQIFMCYPITYALHVVACVLCLHSFVYAILSPPNLVVQDQC